MKRVKMMLIILSGTLCIYSQNQIVYPAKGTDLPSLNAVASLSGLTTAVGFDTRYQGVKGTTRLFDTLMASSLLIRGEDQYIGLESDIDVVRNALLFVKSSSGELMEILSDHITELIVHKEGEDLVYRTTSGISFEKNIPENKFYQVLKEGPYQFIKIPEKEFVEADYKRVYSPDRRYDEYKPVNKYYIEGSDRIFHRVQLTKKSLVKMFPEKKELIERGLEDKSKDNAEIAVISILEQF